MLTYSVGGFTVNGNTLGKDCGSNEQLARETFAHFSNLPQTASMILYRWNEDTGECEEIDSYAA